MIAKTHTTVMRILRTLTVLLLATTFTSVPSSRAFFDEVVALQEELSVWESAHAADFSDVIAQLDDITGTVFRDVGDNDWFHPYVGSLADWGIISGYQDIQGKFTGEFRPGNPVTVAEVLKMSLKAASVDESQCLHQPFHPQAAGHWALRYVACAEKMGIRLMNPVLPADLNRPAKRAEVLTVVHDAFGDEVLPLYSNFTDTAGHAFEADIAFANLYGIVGGDTGPDGQEFGTFRPDASINRAEVAKIIYERLKVTVADSRL